MESYSDYKSYFVNIAILVLVIVAKYFINRKAGEKEWYAVIPFYSTYLLYKYADTVKYYFIVLFTGLIGYFIFTISVFVKLITLIAYLANQDVMTYEGISSDFYLRTEVLSKYSTIGLIVSLVIIAVCWVYKFKQCRGLALNFNASKGFAWILFFFSPIGLLILAFDQAYYYVPLKQEELEENNYYE